MKFIRILLLALIGTAVVSCCSEAPYETVKGDPLQTRIYTLDNGLKVYMSVNKEEPRVQTYIAVRVGSKNDPAETTGLAHYLEHIMFKGTQSFGTMDYEAEKPLLDQIEQLFEVYRQTTDEAERTAIYARIDSISYEASKFGIPNEYDKLMATIGATGTNAYTSNDCTVYIENIPSNQMDNWLRVEADRFKNLVIRGFHTELEAVYEEKNISLSSDSEKLWDKMFELLFPGHPYGTQTTIGTQEHLKNPSITNIKNYFAKWYVPNNMAICLAGDFDPDQTIALIEKYFGDMVPNEELPEPSYEPLAPATSPQTADVIGQEQEVLMMGWRQAGAHAEKDRDCLTIAHSLLYNSKAGLFDVNLNQPMELISSYAFPLETTDHDALILIGYPKPGQTLEEVRDLLLGQVEILRRGEFDETLLESILNNLKVEYMTRQEENNDRARMFVDAFINRTQWTDEVNRLDRLSRITKDDIVEFVNRTMTDQNYVAVYKRQGKDENEQRIAKPQITPIETNRDAQSTFVTEIQNSQVSPIEPVFVDFDRDMQMFETGDGTEILYKRNESSGLFSMYYTFERGIFNDPRYNFAFSYLELLGTDDKSNEEIMREFYNMACEYTFNAGDRRSFVGVFGLGEKMDGAIELLEHWILNAQGDESLLGTLKENVIKDREDDKLNKNANSSALNRYVNLGPDYIKHTTMTNDQIMALTSDELLNLAKELLSHERRILYYGPAKPKELLSSLEKVRFVPEALIASGESVHYPYRLTPENTVYVVYYDSPQLICSQMSNNGVTYNPENEAKVTLFNEYFGGGMNSIVFQELREARGLAYSAWAGISSPRLAKDYYLFRTYIGTQNDKMDDAMSAFSEIIENMPLSEQAFAIAKEAIVSRINTERITKSSILWMYVSLQDRGLSHDLRKDIYEGVKAMTLDDMAAFHKEWIEGRTYAYSLVADTKDIDMKKLHSLGNVTILTQEEIFGY